MGIVEKADGELPLGHCPACAVKMDESMKAFARTYRGIVPPPKSEADVSYEPEPELPQQMSVALDDDEPDRPLPDMNQERDDDERDEYWR